MFDTDLTRDYQAAVDEAQAQLDQAKAAIANLDAQIEAQRARIDQAEKCERREQRPKACRADAADLQIGPAGQVDQPVAVMLGKVGDA